MTPPAEVLAGRRILVVEDEPLLAMLVEDLLLDAGCVVIGPATSVSDALRLLDLEPPDAAVLDVNLTEEQVYPVATRLEQAGVPYVFVTGYGVHGLHPDFSDRPTIQKPFRPGTFAAEIAVALKAARWR